MSDELRPTTTEAPETLAQYVEAIEAAVRAGDPALARAHGVHAKGVAVGGDGKLAERVETAAIALDDMARGQDAFAGLAAGAMPVLFALLKDYGGSPGVAQMIYAGLAVALLGATYAFATAKLQRDAVLTLRGLADRIRGK